MMIKPNKIEPQVVAHFDPDGNSLGFLNEYEHYDLRLQIAKARAKGYYMAFMGEKVYFDTYGALDRWPNGLYDIIQNTMGDLMEEGFEIAKEICDGKRA